LPAARAAVTEAESRKFAAEAAAETANTDAAEAIAASFLTGTKPSRSAPTAATARAELAAAVEAVVIARNAKVILDGKVEKARSSVAFALDKVKKSCLQVIGSEKLSELLGAAIAGRAKYIDAIGQLAWLLQQHAVDDAGVRQFVGEANTPPSTWPEAASAGAAAMESAMNALLADADAVI
jgi:hypothetical protein